VSGMQNLWMLNWWCTWIRRDNNQIYIIEIFSVETRWKAVIWRTDKEM